MRRLMITVDVEAQTGRADRDHLDRLIWGKFPEGRAGIGEMMDISDRHGVKMTMFLDWCEEHLYGDGLLDVGREIHRRGHDLQLHAHLDFMHKDWWAKNKIKPQFSLNELDADQAKAAIGFIAERQAFATGTPAVAFRGGGYRFNDHVLDALVEHGAPLDSSVNVSRATQPVKLPNSKQFVWSNGCLEVPVSCVTGYRNYNRVFDFNFNASGFPDAASMVEYLDVFYAERGDDAIANLVMHSWSFLELTDKKFYTRTVPESVRRFDAFLGLLKGKVAVVTARQTVQEHQRGTLAADSRMETSLLGNRAPPPAKPAPVAPDPPTPLPKLRAAPTTQSTDAIVDVAAAPTTTPCCPICGAEKAGFTALNGRQCPGCGSVERQRSFAVAYDQAIRQKFDVTSRDMLIFSPSRSEIQFFETRGLGKKRSVDIRPEAKPDIVADMCAMPQIPSASESLVFASYLMPVVHDLDKALDEVARVLAPDGVFISVELVTPGKPTVETKDPAALIGWYGKEAYEKYKVGSHRTLGESDYLAALSKRFSVERYRAVDPITGVPTLVHIGHSRQGRKHSIEPLKVTSERHTGTIVMSNELGNGQLTVKSHAPAVRKFAPGVDVTEADLKNFKWYEDEYFKERAKTPSLTYAQYSVANQIKYINAGGQHRSLGLNLGDARNKLTWERDGLGIYNEYKSLVPNFGSNTKVVDYACGSLRVGQHFIRALDPGNYIGIDVWLELINMGRDALGSETVTSKKPRFFEITRPAIDEAVDLQPDLTVACSVAYQVHPIDYPEFIYNLSRISSKPGAILVFDAKIAPRFERYKSSGWVFTQDFYDQLFAGYEVVEQRYQFSQTLGNQQADTFLMVYRRR